MSESLLVRRLADLNGMIVHGMLACREHLTFAPGIRLGMVAADQHVGHRYAAIDRRTGILRSLQKSLFPEGFSRRLFLAAFKRVDYDT